MQGKTTLQMELCVSGVSEIFRQRGRHAPEAGDKEHLCLVGQGRLEGGGLAHGEVDHAQLGLVLQQPKHRKWGHLTLHATPSLEPHAHARAEHPSSENKSDTEEGETR